MSGDIYADGDALSPSEIEAPKATKNAEQTLSLRDYFAGSALSGLIAADNNARWPSQSPLTNDAYDWADAMLAARKVENG